MQELSDFLAHEKTHREIFRAELLRRGRRRCRSYHLCGLGGLVLGFLTGLLGRSAIAATTVAVESVVLRHLEEQLRALEGSDPAAVAAISAIVETSGSTTTCRLCEPRLEDFWPRVLTPVVSMSNGARHLDGDAPMTPNKQCDTASRVRRKRRISFALAPRGFAQSAATELRR